MALEHGGDPAGREDVGEAAYVLAQLVGRVGLGLQVLPAVRPKKSVSAAARTRSARWGCSSASSRVSHWVAAAVLKTDAAGVEHGGYADRGQGVLRGEQVGPAGGEHRDVLRLDRSRVVARPDGRAARQQALDRRRRGR